MNTNYTALTATTLDNARKKMVDEIFQNHVFFHKLEEKGLITEEDGGNKIVVPLMYDTNSTVKSYSHLDELDLTYQEGITAAEFNWKEMAGTVVISDRDTDINSGKTQIFNLLEAKLKQLKLSFMQTLVGWLYSDGTGNGGKDFTGLAAAVSTSGTYAGISKTAYAYWQSYLETTTEALGLAKMRTAQIRTMRGQLKSKCDLILTTDTLFSAYEALLQPHYVIENQKLAAAGFDNLNFKGTPITWDEQCTSTYMYFLCTDFFKLVMHKNANFKRLVPIRPAKQTATVHIMRAMGNLTCEHCKKQSLLTNKS